MKLSSEVDSESRREFLKSLPQQLVNGIRSLSSTHKDGNPEKVPEPKVARLDITRCLAWGGASCQLCYLACSLRDGAIEMHDQKPVIIASVCDGCAMCITACETVNDLPALKMVCVEEKMS